MHFSNKAEVPTRYILLLLNIFHVLVALKSSLLKEFFNYTLNISSNKSILFLSQCKPSQKFATLQ